MTSNQAVYSYLLSVEIYLRKLIDLDHEGTLEAPFSSRVQGPQKPLSKGPLCESRGSPGPLYMTNMTKKVFINVKRTKKMYIMLKK